MDLSGNGALSVLQSLPSLPDGWKGPLLGVNVVQRENRNGKLRTGISQ